MAKKIINAFNAGEVTPNVHARTDNELYDSACLKMENFLPLEYGGASRRPSTKYCYELNAKSIIIPFNFNVDTCFNLVFSNENLTILDSNNNLITSLSSPYLESELEELKYYQSLDTIFLTHKNHEPRKIERRIVNNTNSFSFSTFDFKVPPLLDINESDILITTSEKSGNTNLIASNDFFELNHEGSYFVFNEIRDTKNQTVDSKFDTIVSQTIQGGSSDTLNVSLSNWSVETLGKWSGKVVIQKSTDGGSTFEDYVVVGDTIESSGADNIKNFSFASSEPEPINTIIRARFTGGSGHGISGAACNILIKAENPYNVVVVKIDTFISATEVTATILTPFQETISDYNNTHSSSKSDYKKGDKIQVTAPFSYSGSGSNIDFANLDLNNDILNIRGCVYSGDDQDGTLYVLTDDGTASGKRVITFTRTSGTFGNAVRNATLTTAIQSEFTLSKKSVFDIDLETIGSDDYIAVLGYTQASSSSDRNAYASTDYGTQLKVIYFKISNGVEYPYGRTLTVNNNYSWYQGGSIGVSPSKSLLFKTNVNHSSGIRTYSGDLNSYNSKFYGSLNYEDNSLKVITDNTTNRPYNDGYPAYVDITYISDSNTFYAIDKDSEIVDQITENAEYRTSFDVSGEIPSNIKPIGGFSDGTNFYIIRTDGTGLQYSVGAETKYYECLVNDPSSGAFATQQSIGVWGERFPRIKDWYEGAFSKKNGFPKSVSIYDNRLVFAGTNKNPNTLWISAIDDLNNFNLGSLDTNAIKITLSSLTQNDIQWLCSARNLVIGTSANEWSLGSGNQNIPITPTEFNLKRRSQYGSSQLQGLLVNSAVLFLMRQNKKIREWYLQENQEDYLASDLAYIAEHITGEGIVQMAVQTQPTTIIWMVRNDGVLVGLTYERETKTFAWHRHTFEGTVESVSVLPTASDEDKVFLSIKRPDVEERDIVQLDKQNWGTDYTTEYSGLDFYTKTSTPENVFPNPTFSDSSQWVEGSGWTIANGKATCDGTDNARLSENIPYGEVPLNKTVRIKFDIVEYTSGLIAPVVGAYNVGSNFSGIGTYTEDILCDSPNTTDKFEFMSRDGNGFVGSIDNVESFILTEEIENLDHLEGKNVTVVDGGTKLSSTYTVTSGSITIPPTGNNVYAGLPYTSTLAPLYLDANGSMGSKKSVPHAVIRFKDTLKAKVGQKESETYGENDASVLDEVKFKSSTVLNNEDAEVWLSNANEFLQTIYVVQDEPSPCTVLAMVVDVESV